MVATGTPEIRSVSFHHDGETVRHAVKDRAGVDFVVAPRRYVLDALLADAAVAAGARLVTDTTVTGVLRDAGGRVIGVTARDADGTPRELMARLVVGADGLRSSVARYVGAQVVERHDPTGACFYTYVGEVDWDGIQLHVEDDAFAGVFPTHHGEACVWLIRPVDELAPVMRAGADRATAWLAALDRTVPELARTVREGPDHRAAPGVRRAPQPPAPAVGSGLGPGRGRRLPPRPDHRARDDRRVPRRRAARRRRGRGPAQGLPRGRRDGGLRAAARTPRWRRPSR